MRIRVLALSLLSLAIAGCQSYSLPGRWAPVSAVKGGVDYPVSNFDGATLRVTKKTYEFGGDQGTLVMITGTHPTQFDIHGKVGPNAGRTIPAIYLVEADFLTVCYELGGGERPRDFISPEGSQVLLVHYKRIP